MRETVPRWPRCIKYAIVDEISIPNNVIARHLLAESAIAFPDVEGKGRQLVTWSQDLTHAFIDVDWNFLISSVADFDDFGMDRVSVNRVFEWTLPDAMCSSVRRESSVTSKNWCVMLVPTVIESVTRAVSESYGRRRESQQRKPALVFLANSSAGLGGKQTRRPHAHSPAQGGSLNHGKTDRRRKRQERLCEDHDDKLNTRPSIKREFASPTQCYR